MGRWSGFVGFVVVALGSVGLAGCGGGEAARIAELAVQQADRAATSPWITASERAAAQRAAKNTGGLSTRVVELVRRHVDDLDEDDAKRVVKYACEANDLAQVGPNPTQAKVKAYVTTHVPGTYGRRSRATELAEDLRTTWSSGDVFTKLAVASTCEAMS